MTVMITQRKKLAPSSTLELMTDMTEGNMGATTILIQLAEKPDPEGFIRMMDLDDMNIRGWQIWSGYKDHCNSDIDTFIEAIKNRDASMVDTINAEGQRQANYDGNAPCAVTSGASSHRPDLLRSSQPTG